MFKVLISLNKVVDIKHILFNGQIRLIQGSTHEK